MSRFRIIRRLGRYSLIAVRNRTANDTGLVSIGHVVVTTGVSTAVDLTMGSAREYAHRACSSAAPSVSASVFWSYSRWLTIVA